jgi:hypothetical protein
MGVWEEGRTVSGRGGSSTGGGIGLLSVVCCSLDWILASRTACNHIGTTTDGAPSFFLSAHRCKQILFTLNP